MKKVTSLLALLLVFASQAQLNDLRSPTLQELPDSLHKRDLIELSEIFNTDKQPSLHNFIDLYNRYLTPLQDSVHRILEIGIFNGASHKMWKCYFDSAEVYGIDIREKPWVEKLGIHTYLANQANREDLQTFVDSSGGNFDVIIDDGGHYMSHQQVSLGFLFEHLNEGGLYIIEDVHTSLPAYYDGFGRDSTLSNTTLKIFTDYIMNEDIESVYMTKEEKVYLETWIEYIEIYKRKNSMHSTAVVIRKKKKR
ncbi:class I SAM-dependent methyltransferase [bacterium]|nr:class I SAM-dependent methyltransferase [bacterium]